MASAQETFRATVIEPLKVNRGIQALSYAEYLRLPAAQRSNDEADVVDSRFTQKLLEWLGFETADIAYNYPTPGLPQNRPDFVAKMFGSTAFVVEDKSTDEQLDAASIHQLRRYTVGTSGYCLWTNARSIVGLRFDANGDYQTLVEVRVDTVFGNLPSPVDQDANFEILKLLYSKERFSDLANIIDAIAIDENEWRQRAKSLTDEASLREFIDASRDVLDRLATAIRARLSNVTLELAEAAGDLASSQKKYLAILSNLFDRLKGGGGVNLAEVSKLEEELHDLASRLIDMDTSYTERLKPAMSAATIPLWNSSIEEIKAVVSGLRERELARNESRRIRAAYLVWLERYKYIEGEERGDEHTVESRRQRAFAEQVSYVFFVRLLLVRVLEDKGIMARIVSDGGFKHWFSFLRSSSLEDRVHEIRGEAFLPLVYSRVVSFYRHFFQQPVFDWFMPDDYLLALALYRLNMYNFKDVTNDLLGFTYEAFIDRVARNQKGHFLTPPSIVEFMLDRAGYADSSIIGESLLDPACGSGSFLVHAARRLRQAIASGISQRDPVECARLFIEQVKTRLVGLEVNPFSCYLAELNLFIQVLDDLALLWKKGERPDIERFAIYNTNSLEMPQAVLNSGYETLATSFGDEATSLDEAASVKSKRANFSYVISNPPYVNRGIVLGAKSYGEYPFYREVVKGDENFYLLFLRLATYYIAQGGTVCFICPLNLFGDESTTRAREMINRWSIHSITRFYARDMLFPGVLQGVCILRFDHRPADPADTIEIRGGFSTGEAAQSASLLQSKRVIQNYPARTTWNKPWLVNANPAAYDLWEFALSNSKQDLADLLEKKMEVGKGDVRSTWAKPMLNSRQIAHGLPLTKGKNVMDWGGWSTVAYLDPFAAISSSIKDYTGSKWVQKQIQRIANLTRQETALFLKEVSGLEMKRPIRGTILQRDNKHPVVADETLLVMYTLEAAYEDLAYAAFGLVTSEIYNLFFSLFSTNAHANFKEILRLPVPNWSPELEQRLASETKNVLQIYQKLHQHQEKYGVEQAQHISVSRALQATALPTLRLEDMVLRGDITLNGATHYSLEVLQTRGLLTFNSRLDAASVQALGRILRANGKLSYLKEGKDILVPNPRVAATFLDRLDKIEAERASIHAQVSSARRTLDDIILDAYCITNPAWREIVDMGVPWAK
ncbi:MAG: N-6 DNA methylase [Ktedonobacteraceae bacterium]